MNHLLHSLPVLKGKFAYAKFKEFVSICFQIMFEVVQVVDNGRTQVGRAGRINPKYENQGFIKYFGASLNEWRRKNNIKRISFVINDANPALRKATFQQRYRHVSTKVSLSVR